MRTDSGRLKIEIQLFLGSMIFFLSVGLIVTEFSLQTTWVNSILLNPVQCPATLSHVTEEFSVEYKLNKDCFRGAEINTEQFDYLLLGDSFFFGLGVDESGIVAQRLNDKGSRVLNASENATNPPEFLIRLRDLYARGVRSKKIITSLFIGNDFQGIGGAKNLNQLLQYDPSAVERRSFFSFPRSRFLFSWLVYRTLHPANYFIRDYKYLRRFRTDWLDWYSNGDSEKVRKTKERKYQTISSDTEYFRKSEINEDSEKNVLLILQQLVQIDNAAQFSIMLIPDLHYEKGEVGHAYEEFRARLIKRLPKNIEVLDLHGRLRPSDFFLHDGHWNSSGHQKVADFITTTRPSL